MILRTLPLSSDWVRCQRGDYVLRRKADGRVEIYRVQDLVRLVRLVPFGDDELVDEDALLDSERATFQDEIFLLLTSFEREFASFTDGLRAAGTSDLGDGNEGLCRNIRDFPATDSRVYRPTARP